jgi:hypothetical protein
MFSYKFHIFVILRCGIRAICRLYRNGGNQSNTQHMFIHHRIIKIINQFPFYSCVQPYDGYVEIVETYRCDV